MGLHVRAPVQIDFDKLDIAALKRYKGHYNLRVKHNATKSELAAAIARHFENHAVEELETITYFLYTVRNNGTSSLVQRGVGW